MICNINVDREQAIRLETPGQRCRCHRLPFIQPDRGLGRLIGVTSALRGPRLIGRSVDAEPNTPLVLSVLPLAMVASTGLAFLLLAPRLVSSLSLLDALQVSPTPSLSRRASSRNVPAEGFYDPRSRNGSWLTVSGNLHPLVS